MQKFNGTYSKAEVIKAVLAELNKAEESHPIYPEGFIGKFFILLEEVGEAINAFLIEEDVDKIRAEMIQVCATCMRFLLSVPPGTSICSAEDDDIRKNKVPIYDILVDIADIEEFSRSALANLYPPIPAGLSGEVKKNAKDFLQSVADIMNKCPGMSLKNACLAAHSERMGNKVKNGEWGHGFNEKEGQEKGELKGNVGAESGARPEITD